MPAEQQLGGCGQRSSGGPQCCQLFDDEPGVACKPADAARFLDFKRALLARPAPGGRPQGHPKQPDEQSEEKDERDGGGRETAGQGGPNVRVNSPLPYGPVADRVPQPGPEVGESQLDSEFLRIRRLLIRRLVRSAAGLNCGGGAPRRAAISA